MRIMKEEGISFHEQVNSARNSILSLHVKFFRCFVHFLLEVILCDVVVDERYMTSSLYGNYICGKWFIPSPQMQDCWTNGC